MSSSPEASSSSTANNGVSEETPNKKEEENYLSEAVSAEEFLEKKGFGMLPYQKQMFLDMIYSDGLLVCAKYFIENIITR